MAQMPANPPASDVQAPRPSTAGTQPGAPAPVLRRRQFFVTGTDTEVGKTFVTSAMLASLADAGRRVFGLKPVAAGAEERQGQWVNEDALALMDMSSVRLSYQQVNPILLRQAVAPHIAADREGRSISVARLAGYCRGAFTTPHDVVFVEGAGGWLVPINGTETLADLAAALALPVILVVGLRLGCINHALLTADAVRRSGLTLAGWVANACSREAMCAQDANIEALRARLGAPLLGIVPRAASPRDHAVQQALDLAALFGGPGDPLYCGGPTTA